MDTYPYQGGFDSHRRLIRFINGTAKAGMPASPEWYQQESRENYALFSHNPHELLEEFLGQAIVPPSGQLYRKMTDGDADRSTNQGWGREAETVPGACLIAALQYLIRA